LALGQCPNNATAEKTAGDLCNAFNSVECGVKLVEDQVSILQKESKVAMLTKVERYSWFKLIVCYPAPNMFGSEQSIKQPIPE
jgi:sulfur relay (sulfurtransferase) DsrF/TusC family protein